MTADLIPIATRRIAEAAVQTIDSAELHAFLGVTTEHGKWISRRIESYGFQEGVDYVCSSSLSSKGRGGHNRAVFWISLDMGKQLAMVERGEKGREAREYFIQCERQAKAPSLLAPAISAEVDARLTRIEQQVAAQGTKAGAFDRLTDQRGALSLTATAKVLGIAPHQFFAWLSTMAWTYRARDFGSWLGRQDKIDAGYLIQRLHPIEHAAGFERMHPQVLITARGVARLAELLEQASCARTPMPVPSSTY